MKWTVFFYTLFFLVISPSTVAEDADLTFKQEQYLSVRKAIRYQKPAQYIKALEDMKDYPLYPYLRYQHQARQIGSMTLQEYDDFTKYLSYTPLKNMARYRYLLNLGYYKRWEDFLVISPKEPRDKTLKCYYFRAQLQAGDPKIGWAGARKMWLSPYSQKNSCDILFKEWQKAGKRTEDDIWQRMLLAFDYRRLRFMGYLKKELTSKEYQYNATQLISVYRNPKLLLQDDKFSDNDAPSVEVIYHGLKRLARKNPSLALKTYEIYEKQQSFTQAQQEKLINYLIYRALLDQEHHVLEQTDHYLAQYPTDKLLEMRLRAALTTQDWQAMQFWVEKLSKSSLQTDRWQYWLAKIYQQNDEPLKAERILNRLAERRSFYGFVSAQELDLEFEFNDEEIQPHYRTQRRLETHPTILRMKELFALNFKAEARQEWLYLLRISSPLEKKQMAVFAKENNWPNLTIEASIQGKTWDALAVRFPLAWQDDFEKYAKARKLTVSELQAIARRESAFNTFARSPVGARGLMQIMPRTARQTARRYGIKYNGRKHLNDYITNIRIGSAYYQQLKKQFNNNRIFAIASYNAGPNRVRNWRTISDGNLDVVSFIETIPFRETREYVQAVLIYNVIYQVFNQDKPMLFSENEWRRKY